MTDNEVIQNLFNELNDKTLSIVYAINNRSLDGRINSINNENSILNSIEEFCNRKGWSFERMPPRDWCDFKINNTPFNLKNGKGGTADNLSSKKGLVYALTGKEISNGASHKVALETIVKNFNANGKSDYGILFLNKLTSKFYVSSLRNIDTKLLVPNGNNLPFQIKLDRLDNTLDHSKPNQALIVLKKYNESIEKRNIDNSSIAAMVRGVI